MFSKKQPIKNALYVQKQSKKALSLFRKAIEQLKEASSEAEIIKSNNEVEIQLLVTENKSLDTLVKDNTKVVENISSLIGEEK